MINIIKLFRFEFYVYLKIKISSQLISIFGYDNKCSTISEWPFFAAIINAVLLID